jgi:hypothetical protein
VLQDVDLKKMREKVTRTKVKKMLRITLKVTFSIFLGFAFAWLKNIL